MTAVVADMREHLHMLWRQRCVAAVVADMREHVHMLWRQRCVAAVVEDMREAQSVRARLPLLLQRGDLLARALQQVGHLLRDLVLPLPPLVQRVEAGDLHWTEATGVRIGSVRLLP